jgi:hypothetical protein
MWDKNGTAGREVLIVRPRLGVPRILHTGVVGTVAYRAQPRWARRQILLARCHLRHAYVRARWLLRRPKRGATTPTDDT